MSDVKIKFVPNRPHALTRRAAVPTTNRRSAVPSDAQVAAEIFRVPTREEVTAAGYPADRWESIRDKQLASQERFVSDAEFRADVTREYGAHMQRTKDSGRQSARRK